MPKYIVVHTPLRHGKKGAKTADTYMPGDEIELTDEEAAALGANLKAAAKPQLTKRSGKGKK